MKVVITGTRNITDYDLVDQTIKDSEYKITEINCGDQQGVDVLAQSYAKKKRKKLNVFVPDWKKYGRNARDISDVEMVKDAEAVFLFWDGNDAGCKIVYREATAKRIPIISKVVT